MKIAVLGNKPNWYFDQLSAAAGIDHQVEFVAWEQLVAEVGTGESVGTCPNPNTDFDCVLVRGMPVGSLEQVIFRMNVLARWQACGVRVVNPPRALEIAIDKYLSLALIGEAGLPIPRSFVCQTVDRALECFEALGGDVVVKPVFGGEGRGIIRITNKELALRAFRSIANLQSVIYLQEFIASPQTGAGGYSDLRILLIGEDVFGMRRTSHDDWRTNASLGSNCEYFEPESRHIELARTAAKVAGTMIAGVDLIETADGKILVLEVNGIPGWKSIQGGHEANFASLLLDWLQRTSANS